MGASKDDERMAEAGGEVAQEDVAMNGAGESSGKDEGVVAKVQVRDVGRCCEFGWVKRGIGGSFPVISCHLVSSHLTSNG